MSDNKDITLQDSVNSLASIMYTGGYSPDGVHIEFRDALATPNFPMAFKKVVTTIVQEAIEPILIGEKLLTRLSFDGIGSSITFQTFGALGVSNLDMAEGQEYPEFSLTNGGGQATANIFKSGLALKVTDEMIRYSQWDVVAMHLRQAGRALARWKEKKIFDMLNSMGFVVFDNTNPTTAEIGRTSGRGLAGAGNGSFTADDLFDMYASLLEKGFQPDTILCHPLAWATFVKDPVMREYALGGGGLNNWFTSMPRNVSPNTPAAWKAANKLTGNPPYNLTQEERQGTQTSTFNFPSYFPSSATGLRILPSPHVPFDAVAKTTSIIMLDSNNTGAIVVAEDPTMEEWRDQSVDITKIKIRERYGLAVFNDGQAVAVARNISIEPNEIVLPPQATVANLPKIVKKP